MLQTDIPRTCTSAHCLLYPIWGLESMARPSQSDGVVAVRLRRVARVDYIATLRYTCGRGRGLGCTFRLAIPANDGVDACMPGR